MSIETIVFVHTTSYAKWVHCLWSSVIPLSSSPEISLALIIFLTTSIHLFLGLSLFLVPSRVPKYIFLNNLSSAISSEDNDFLGFLYKEEKTDIPLQEVVDTSILKRHNILEVAKHVNLIPGGDEMDKCWYCMLLSTVRSGKTWMWSVLWGTYGSGSYDIFIKIQQFRKCHKTSMKMSLCRIFNIFNPFYAAGLQPDLTCSVAHLKKIYYHSIIPLQLQSKCKNIVKLYSRAWRVSKQSFMAVGSARHTTYPSILYTHPFNLVCITIFLLYIYMFIYLYTYISYCVG